MPRIVKITIYKTPIV